MSQANLDLVSLQETNITDGIFTHRSTGYSVVAMDAPIRHSGGMAVIYWVSPWFVVESIHKFGPNFFRFQLERG